MTNKNLLSRINKVKFLKWFWGLFAGAIVLIVVLLDDCERLDWLYAS